MKRNVLAFLGALLVGAGALVLAPHAALATNYPPSGYAIQGPLNGVPVLLGVIQASTTKNNNDTATPFNNTGDALEGKVLMIQCDAAANVRCDGTTSTVTASATITNAAYGPHVDANQVVYCTMSLGFKWVAAVGSANCAVWEMR